MAQEVKKIGGLGTIHGCIVDIDFYNHIYVNPYDSKLTAYWAPDMINKKVYNSISDHLKIECPQLYANYRKLLKTSKQEIRLLSKGAGKKTNASGNEVMIPPKDYFDTDIYKASREVCRMQKLYENILTVWVEKETDHNKKTNNMIDSTR